MTAHSPQEREHSHRPRERRALRGRRRSAGSVLGAHIRTHWSQTHRSFSAPCELLACTPRQRSNCSDVPCEVAQVSRRQEKLYTPTYWAPASLKPNRYDSWTEMWARDCTRSQCREVPHRPVQIFIHCYSSRCLANYKSTDSPPFVRRPSTTSPPVPGAGCDASRRVRTRFDPRAGLALDVRQDLGISCTSSAHVSFGPAGRSRVS